MTLARSSADLSPQQLDRAFAAFAVLRAQIVAIENGLPVSELGKYNWRAVPAGDVQPAGGAAPSLRRNRPSTGS